MKTCIKLLLAFLLFTMVGCGKDVTTYYTNGHRKSEGNLRDNKKEGLWIHWHDNGQKWSETHWKNGERDGLFTWWRENGQKRLEIDYKDGKIISEKKF